MKHRVNQQKKKKKNRQNAVIGMKDIKEPFNNVNIANIVNTPVLLSIRR